MEVQASVLCSFAAGIWLGLLLKMGIYRNTCQSWTAEILWYVQAFAGQTIIARVKKVILNSFIHHLWRERNNRVFASKFSSTDQVGFAILEDVRIRVSSIQCKADDNPFSRSFMDKIRVRCQFIPPSVITYCSWLFPDQDLTMVNTDGSKKDHSGGWGDILRNCSGNVVATAKGGGPPISANAHELHGVELGLNLAIVKGIRKIHLAMDSMYIYNLMVQKIRKPPWSLIQIWRRVEKLLPFFEVLKISHIFMRLIELLTL
ncbi:uncharacterized protein LOC113356285 [Papaver somniferum]|uniref:uncharacterized protein LOC113356285 n=1 Tax=Papaver somniferum TaxID=3469 RepID=UPI000E6F6868|nr:uncharacterized protein LOC113356285 [Papaver somniferum]